ncbi:hypothetical protein BDV25DRAFT_168511 [Aspergillus avenaceus]|uniref:Restriction endonuclease type IV Mrr domain-containing protein n=1 Tax=Aspergillus avenaceus TaxID=36643 RepID=A0A5N6TQG5_ASPAV|nr:hypothetical protein BDV25DRAFT_168511 [Aspergillus avenaceus]
MNLHLNVPRCNASFRTTSFRNSVGLTQFNRSLSSLTRRLFKLPSPPPHPSPHHYDLKSFLAYAEKSSLSLTTTSYVGTHYEYTVQQTLRNVAFSLHRVGGRSDAGIDLVGTWHLPGHEHALRAIVQCKSFKTKLGPNIVRELEGTFHQAPVGWRTGEHKLGVLVSPREATKGVREALARSTFPLMWMMVERGGVLRQVLWNGRAERQLGLVGLGVEMRYSGAEVEGVTLTWDGEEVPHMDAVEGRMAEVQDRWMRLWGIKLESEEEREGLVDAVQGLVPGEKPLLFAEECSTLSGEERARVLQAWKRDVDMRLLNSTST